MNTEMMLNELAARIHYFYTFNNDSYLEGMEFYDTTDEEAIEGLCDSLSIRDTRQRVYDALLEFKNTLSLASPAKESIESILDDFDEIMEYFGYEPSVTERLSADCFDPSLHRMAVLF